MLLAIAIFIFLFRSTIQNATTGRNYEIALIRIFLHYFTSLVLIKSFDMNWPNSMQTTLDVLAFIDEANEEIMPPKCLITTDLFNTSDVYVKLIYMTFLPLIVVVMVWFCWTF
jgi:hypothetical protein